MCAMAFASKAGVGFRNTVVAASRVRPKLSKRWLDFEYYCMEWHAYNYGHKVWHTTQIPQNILYESGMLHRYNSERLLHVARKQGQFPDYGIDFIAREETQTGKIVYHACQSKCYDKNKVTAKDIGTFLATVMGQVKEGNGYLYTVGDLEINLKECVTNMDNKIVHHKLIF